MPSSSNKRIAYSVDNPETKDVLSQIAKAKGFDKVGTMARVALFQYINRFVDKVYKEKLQDARDARDKDDES